LPKFLYFLKNRRVFFPSAALSFGPRLTEKTKKTKKAEKTKKKSPEGANRSFKVRRRRVQYRQARPRRSDADRAFD